MEMLSLFLFRFRFFAVLNVECWRIAIGEWMSFISHYDYIKLLCNLFLPQPPTIRAKQQNGKLIHFNFFFFFSIHLPVAFILPLFCCCCALCIWSTLTKKLNKPEKEWSLYENVMYLKLYLNKKKWKSRKNATNSNNNNNNNSNGGSKKLKLRTKRYFHFSLKNFPQIIYTINHASEI